MLGRAIWGGCLVLVIALCVTAEDDGGVKDEGRETMAESPLEWKILLVADHAGHSVEAGERAWVVWIITNVSTELFWLPPAAIRAKGDGIRGRAPSFLAEDQLYMGGIGVSSLVCRWESEEGSVVLAERLDPPDSFQRGLEPGASQIVWRRIDSPTRAGKYRLVLELDPSEILSRGTGTSSMSITGLADLPPVIRCEADVIIHEASGRRQ